MQAMQAMQYLVGCSTCGGLTTKRHARTHGGQCKVCATPAGVAPSGRLRCPDCGGWRTAYQAAHRYHCDGCTREADPEGYRREVMGYNDGPDY